MTTNATPSQEKLEPDSCPWCGKLPQIRLGKKWHCQLHGEPSQPVIVKCENYGCLVRPAMSAGDVYNGGEIKARNKAVSQWNTRTTPSRIDQESPLGHCPICGGNGISREKRPNGNDICENKHTYPSASSVPDQPATMRSAEEWTDEMFFPDSPTDLEDLGEDFVEDWAKANSHARWQNIEIIRAIQQDAIASRPDAQAIRDKTYDDVAHFVWQCAQGGKDINDLPDAIRALKSKPSPNEGGAG